MLAKIYSQLKSFFIRSDIYQIKHTPVLHFLLINKTTDIRLNLIFKLKERQVLNRLLIILTNQHQKSSNHSHFLKKNPNMNHSSLTLLFLFLFEATDRAS